MSTKVQENLGTSGATNTITVTPGTGFTLGNSIIMPIGGSTLTNALCNTPTMTGTSGWARLASSNTGATTHSEMWVALIGAASGNCVTTHGTAHNFRNNIMEWSGLDLTGATGLGLFNPATLNPVTNSITPTPGRACLIIASAVNSTGNLTLPINGFTPLTTNNGVLAHAFLQVASASGSYSTGWSNSGSFACDTTIAVIYEAAGGAGNLALQSTSNNWP